MKQTAAPWSYGVVLLPVALEHVVKVAEYAAALAAGRPVTELLDAELTEAVLVPGQGRWTRDMITRLSDAVTYDAVLGLLDRCARRPNQWVKKSEVEASEGVSAIQLRNELGAFSKKTRKLFGEAVWPMEWKKERGAYSYRLDATIAQWWTTARKA